MSYERGTARQVYDDSDNSDNSDNKRNVLKVQRYTGSRCGSAKYVQYCSNEQAIQGLNTMLGQVSLIWI